LFSKSRLRRAVMDVNAEGVISVDIEQWNKIRLYLEYNGIAAFLENVVSEIGVAAFTLRAAVSESNGHYDDILHDGGLNVLNGISDRLSDLRYGRVPETLLYRIDDEG
jgi:hypothetical protein